MCHMSPEQCRMARAALNWSGSQLASAADIGSATVARFELGERVQPSKIAVMRETLERNGVRFAGAEGWISVILLDGGRRESGR